MAEEVRHVGSSGTLIAQIRLVSKCVEGIPLGVSGASACDSTCCRHVSCTRLGSSTARGPWVLLDAHKPAARRAGGCAGSSMAPRQKTRGACCAPAHKQNHHACLGLVQWIYMCTSLQALPVGPLCRHGLLDRGDGRATSLPQLSPFGARGPQEGRDTAGEAPLDCRDVVATLQRQDTPTMGEGHEAGCQIGVALGGQAELPFGIA